MFAKKPVLKSKKGVPKHQPSTLSAEIVIESDSDGVVEIPSPFGAKQTNKSFPLSSTEKKLRDPKKESPFTKRNSLTGLGLPRKVSLARDTTPVHNGSSFTKDSSSTFGKFPSNANLARKAGSSIGPGSSVTAKSSQNVRLSQKATSSAKASMAKKAVIATKFSPTTLSAAVSVSSGNDSSSSSSTGSVDESSTASRRQGNEDSQLDVDDEQDRSTKSATPKISPSSLQPSTPFEPPAGFKPVSVSLSNSSRLSEIFSPSNLNGKQIWHMTIPARVSISALEEASLNSILKGSAIFHYRNDDYGFAQDLEHKQVQKQVLIASDEYKYRTTAMRVNRSLQLRQLVNLPSLAKETQNPINGQSDLVRPKVYIKTVRQQPNGLRMRYRPFGDTGRLSNSASENEDTALSFKNPPQLEKSPIKKRKIAHLISDEESQGIKTKKSRKDLPATHDINVKKRVEDAHLRTDQVPFILRTSKSNEDHEESQEMSAAPKQVVNDVNSRMINNIEGKHGKGTREERAKQKEEKKRRKEARRVAKDQGNLDVENTNKSKRKKHLGENIEES